MRKTFQTSMEESFGVGAVEIGTLNAMFGILALACYFPGGWLADRLSARRLLSASLFATGLGGLFMLTIPSYPELLALHAFWGITSILTFWAALIKATRNWGGEHLQGTSFGLLDGGRGLVAALLATFATAAYAFAGTPKEGLTAVILVYALATFLAGTAVWFVVPDTLYAEPQHANGQQISQRHATSAENGYTRVRRILALPEVWLLAAVIFCAYLLFLGTFDFPAFAERGFDQSKVFGAQLGTFRDWLRPIAAIGAGVLADRIGATRAVSAAFMLLFAAYTTLFFMPTGEAFLWVLWIQVAVAAIAVFALRGVYFALLQEAKIPMTLTGTTVGFVSVIGFAPDIFGHLLSGWFVETHKGSLGYQYYFGLMALVALLGLAATRGIHNRTR